jgi:phage terminase small subunit
MANRRKPDHLKLFHGTFRPSRAAPKHIDLPLVAGVPEPPDWLPNAHAVAEWRRLASLLVANRLLTGASLGTFGVLCSLHGVIVSELAAGRVPTASLVAQFRTLANDFGLTYAGQQKLKPPAAPADEGPNPFAMLRHQP